MRRNTQPNKQAHKLEERKNPNTLNMTESVLRSSNIRPSDSAVEVSSFKKNICAGYLNVLS